MRIIVHISDMHFGKIDTTCIEPMLVAIRAVNPHLIVVSGDFTQRARKEEFEDARNFLKSLEHPHLVIPGNHDIRPLYSPISRIADAYDRYKEYISDVLEPGYIDDEIAIASVNTVRAHAVKDGRVNKKQIDNLVKWFKRIDDKKIKIVVTHHPFDLPIEWPKSKLARRADMAMHELAKAGIDIFMSGHYHHSSIAHTAERYNIENYSAVAIQAGTVSIRHRPSYGSETKQVQSFNLIFIEHPTIRIDTYLFNPEKKIFDLHTSKVFSQKGTGSNWKEEKDLVNKP
jgi:3',5'-cyclic AMP phosphodiesterase CpdA